MITGSCLGPTPAYIYDVTYQLTQAQIGPSEENYTWDKVGNRLGGPTVKEPYDPLVNVPEDSVYSYDDVNRMTQGRKLSYEYDDLGNQTKRIIATGKEWTFYWDGENKLKKAERVKDTVTLRRLTFKYDPFGKRIEKQVTNNPDTTPNITTTTYFYDQEDIVFTSVNDGTTTSKTHYVHGPGIDEPLAMVKDGQASYYHADGLGSIVAITDASGDIVQRYSYEAFGQLTASDPTFDNFYTYTGREYDKETGLYYYRARYYDAMEGRFISVDPLGFAAGDVNLYNYVGGNPINYVDPSGLYNSEMILGGLGEMAGGTVGVASAAYVTWQSGGTLAPLTFPAAVASAGVFGHGSAKFWIGIVQDEYIDLPITSLTYRASSLLSCHETANAIDGGVDVLLQMGMMSAHAPTTSLNAIYELLQLTNSATKIVPVLNGVEK